MAYRIDSDKFLKNLNDFINYPMISMQKFIAEYTFEILYAMAKLTIQDTNQARYLLISKFADKYGFDYEELNDVYYGFWTLPTDNRGWGKNKNKTQLSESMNNKEKNIEITVEDDGLYNQEIGMRNYPSEYHARHTGRDNKKYKVGHITYVTDLINSGNYGALDNLDYDKLTDTLVADIERFLFT